MVLKLPTQNNFLDCEGLHRGLCVTGRPHPSLQSFVGGSHDGPCDVRSPNAMPEMEVGGGG